MEKPEEKITAADNAETPAGADNNVVSPGGGICRKTSIGGQAVLEGVMMRGPSSMALAVRNENGEILLDTVRLKPAKTKVSKLPVIRGMVSFVSSLVLSVQTITKSAAALTVDEEEELSGGAMAIAVVIAVFLSIGLFILLPSLITDGVMWLANSENVLVSSLIEGAFRIAIFIGYLLLASLLKEIRRTYMYHGAEHKVINCFEAGDELTVENVKKHTRRHNRCGTTFMFFVVVVSILIFALTNWFVSLLGFESVWWSRLLIRLALLPLVAGLSFELLRGLAKLKDNLFVRIIRAPGLSLQAITTIEPDDSMIEVAIAAFKAVEELEQNPDTPVVDFKTVELAKARNDISNILKDTGAESAEIDWILCEVLGVKRGELFSVTEIERMKYNKAVFFAKKRAEGQPLQYVLGVQEFFGERVKVTPSVLIPRPETELLCERAINAVNDLSKPHLDTENASAKPDANCTNTIEKQVRVLDLCTGSGCIALALAKKTTAEIVASDISAEALSVATQNLENTKVELVKSDIGEELCRILADKYGRTDLFDIIVSNPPYVATGDLQSLQPEVKKEPLAALDGGHDGLKFYRRIAVDALRLLKPGGILMLEAGVGQAQQIAALLEGFNNIEIFKDYGGIERIITAVKE